MAIVQTQWWCLELPDEWSAEMEDDCVTIADCDGVGEIDITVVRKAYSHVDDSDLAQFAEQLVEQGIASRAVEVGVTRGLLFEYQDDEGDWREWYLARGPLLIYITYHTDTEHSGLDNAIVDEILATLVVLEESDLSE